MSNAKIRILLIEDDEEDYILARDMLSEIEGQPYELDWVSSFDKGREAIDRNEHPVVLLDYRIGERTGLEFLREAVESGCRAPIILMTGQGDREIDLEAMAAGAADYLVKGGIDSALLERSIRYALEKARAEETLAAEKESLAVTLRSIDEGVIAADIDGGVLLMNETAEGLTGWTQDEARSLRLGEVFKIVAEASRQPGPDLLAASLEADASGAPAEPEEHILISRNKEEAIISLTASPLHDRAGGVVGTVVAFRDISKRRQLEENLFRAQKMESIGLLAGGVAHDFNNFLMAMLGNISLARMCVEPGEAAHDRLSSAEQAVWEARQLTEKLIAFSRAGGGIRTTVDTAQLVREATELALRGSMARCNYSKPDDLWPVEVDESQLSQAISNIVINADQAMASNGQIQIRMENILAEKDPGVPFKSGRYVRIVVEDEGDGIAPELLDRIFDPYFSTKRDASGLGLATAFSIIANHNGSLAASSKLYSGAAITLCLPASDQPVEARSEIEETFAPGAMGGKETMQRLLQSDPNVRGIVTTADASDPILGQFQQAGFHGALNKPFKIEELSQMLYEALSEG